MSEIKYVTPSGLAHYDEKIKEVIDGKDKLKGDTLYYDEDKSELQLKSGEKVLSVVTIVNVNADTSAIEEALWQGYIPADFVLSDDSQLMTSDGEKILLTKSL